MNLQSGIVVSIKSKENEMLVSVVTSVYNCEEYIEEMLESILAQSLQDWECILIDDASTDNTWSIIQKYTDARIIAIRNEKNKGLTYNLNQGIARAKGKYIIRMDGDDVAYAPRFQKQVAFMEEHSEIALSGCSMKCFGKRNNLMRNDESDDVLRINLLFNSTVMHPSFIIRKEFLDKYNIWYNEEFRYAQDYNLLYQTIQHGRIANIPDILIKYRVHGKQITTERGIRQQEYADITRELMLGLLDIRLDEQQKRCWLQYCVGNFDFIGQQERKIIIEIQKMIIAENDKKKLFNKKMLQKILEQKFSCCIEENTNIVDFGEKHLTLFLMMNHWVKIKQERKSLEHFLMQRGYEKIVIYGMNYVGETLLRELKDTRVCVVYVVDKNAERKCVNAEISEVVLPERKVDVIIVTAVTYFEDIKKQLDGEVECPIVSLEDILYNI